MLDRLTWAAAEMDIATLLVADHVLRLGSIRHAARFLDRPPSSVSAAMTRLQSQIATPLISVAGNGILPTLEGERLKRDLTDASGVVMRIAGIGHGGGRLELRAASRSISLLMLERFQTVARTGSIRSAAGEIGMGQPQLTRQLKALEREIGVPLLQRTASGVVLTREGRGLLEGAEALESIWSRISHHAADRFRRKLVTARLGAVSPLGHESKIAKILALLAAEWRQTLSRSALFISSNNAEELLAGMQNHTYDVVLLDTDEVPKHLECRVISHSRLMLVGPAKLMKGRKNRIPQLLLEAPLALPSLKSGLRQKFVALVDDLLPEAERERLSIVEVDSIPVLANLVNEHGFTSLLPESALGNPGSFGCVPLPSRYDLRLSLAWHRSPASEKIARLILEILEKRAMIADMAQQK